MPKTVYCVHALSLYLFKLGKAPQMKDLYGIAEFTGLLQNNMNPTIVSKLIKFGRKVAKHDVYSYIITDS